MMVRSVNDRIRLTSARGGWDGYVSEILNGPGGAPMYRVHSPAWGDMDEGVQVVQEVDIDTSLAKDTFSVGESVSLAGQGGTVTADNGDGTFTVSVEEVMNEHLTVTRTHIVPLWRLAVENTT